ncbi:hypothetical protein BH09PSE4_BH09PSE4_21220 [soil metagenome]
MGGESDIVVVAFSPRYLKAFGALIGVEGGHVNDSADRGGETKFGISLRFLKVEGKIDLDGDGFGDFDLDFDGDIDGADIRKLSIADAKYLFNRCFWRALDIESYPRPIGEMIFDQAVNGGALAAKKLLQRAINRLHPIHPLDDDGTVGVFTRNALQAVIEQGCLPELAAAYREEAKARYRAIARADATQLRNLNGWLNRGDLLGKNVT